MPGIFDDLADGNAVTAFAIAKNFPIKRGEIPQLPRTATIQAPDESPVSWNKVIFQANIPPGKWKVSGERSRTIDQPKKKGVVPSTLIDHGITPGEVHFEVETYSGQELRDLQDFYEKYLSPDRALSNANVTTVAHPALYARNIKAVYGFKASVPAPRGEKGHVAMVCTFTAKVFNPKTTIGGSGGSRRPKPVQAGGNIGQSRIDVLLDAVQAGTLGLFGLGLGSSDDIRALAGSLGVNVDDVALQAPASTSPVILPYKDATALSIITGSIPDTMVSDIAAARAPR